MDWNLFWSAFGAIGSTLGSFITAIALIVAIKQYKQPLKKRIDVDVYKVCNCINEKELVELYCISVKNRGVRPITIQSICVEFDKMSVIVDNWQYERTENVRLPYQLEPEKFKDFYYEVAEFRSILYQITDGKIPDKSSKFKILVQDSLGEKHTCKKKHKISELFEDNQSS